MPDTQSDFSMLAAQGAPGSNELPFEVKQGLDRFRELQANMVVENKQNEQRLPPSSVTANTQKGTVTIKDLPIATYEAYERDRQELNQIRGSFHQESERLRMQEQAIRNQPPWVQLATALAGNLAQAKDMPGWVQGLGRTAAQLNPRPEEIQARRLGVLGEEAKVAEKAANLDLAQMREQRLASYEQQTLALETSQLERLKINDKLKREDALHERWDERAEKNLFNPQAFAKEAKAANPDISDQEIQAMIASKLALQTQADELRKKLGDEGFQKFKKQEDLKYQHERGIAELEHQNRLTEIAAKNKGTLNPKTGKPFTQFELKEIAEIEETGILIGNLERDLEAHPDLFGWDPYTRARSWLKSWTDDEASRVRADYDHAVPIMVKLLREGTRGYAQNQRAWVESKTPKRSDSPERLRGKLAFLRGFLEARQKGLDATYVAQAMAREKQLQGQSPYPVSSHAETGKTKKPVEISIDEINRYAK